MIAGISAALKVGAVSAEVVAVEARRHHTTTIGSYDTGDGENGGSGQGGADSDRHPAVQGQQSEQRVVSLTQRRLTDPAAVIAGLPPDTRPVPSVAAYDELLSRRRTSTTVAESTTSTILDQTLEASTP